MNKAKILIVDDDQNLREAIVDTLKLAGYSCIEAVNGLDALAKLAVTEIDMVISDVQMEGMDGHALLNNIYVSQITGIADHRLRKYKRSNQSDA